MKYPRPILSMSACAFLGLALLAACAGAPASRPVRAPAAPSAPASAASPASSAPAAATAPALSASPVPAAPAAPSGPAAAAAPSAQPDSRPPAANPPAPDSPALPSSSSLSPSSTPQAPASLAPATALAPQPAQLPPSQVQALSPVAAPQTPSPATPSPASTAAAPSAAKAEARKLGEIVYEEGQVEIRRGERLLSGADSDIGAAVLSWDLLSTGPKSRVEIDLASSVQGGATIKLAERTVFYFDTAILADGGRRTTARVLAGSVAFKVQKLGATSTFAVTSSDSVLGVRGTAFSVDVTPDGSVLVSCAEGLVACVGHDGMEFRARPGTLVEGGADGVLAPKLVPAEKLLANRAEWIAGKTSGLEKTGAELFVAQSVLLAASRPAFNSAVARLDALAPVLARWEGLLAQGRRLGPAESLDERKALAETLLVCLKALPSFETRYYRLAELSARARDGMVLGGGAEARQKLAGSLAAFNAGRQADDAALGRIRRALYVFSKVEEGTPLGEFFAEKAGF